MTTDEIIAKLRELHVKAETFRTAKYEGRDWKLTEDEIIKFASRHVGKHAADQLYSAIHPGTIGMGGLSSEDGVHPDWKAERVEAVQTELEILIRDSESGYLVPVDEAVPSAATEKFIPAGREHDAYTTIRNIVEQAMESLTIVDPYIDRTLFQLLANVKPEVQIRVLTRSAPPDFDLELDKFGKQGHKIEARRGITDFHDRFILPDGRCFHLGASIKDAGSRGFMIQEIEDHANVNSIRQNMEAAWNGVADVSATPP